MALGASVATCLLGSIFTFCATGEIEILVAFGSVYGTWLTLYLYKLPAGAEIKLSSLLIFPLLMVSDLGLSFKKQSGCKIKAKSKTRSAILRGLVIGGGLLIFLGNILIEADPIFGSYFSFLEFEDLMARVMANAWWLLLIFLSCRLILSGREQKINEDRYGQLTKLIVVGLVAGLFFVFLLTQCRYLFWEIDEFSLTSKLNLSFKTYSEYVRQGFSQLLFAAFVVICTLVWVGDRKKEKSKISPWLRGGGTFLVGETLVLIASALKRLALVYGDHGASINRVLGLVMVLWLVGWLGVLLVQNYQVHLSGVLARLLLGWSVFLLLAISVLNPAELIARGDRPRVNGQTDWLYFMMKSGSDSLAFLPDYLNYLEDSLVQAEASSEGYCQFYDHRVFYMLPYFVERAGDLRGRYLGAVGGDLEQRRWWGDWNWREAEVARAYLTEATYDRMLGLAERIEVLREIDCVVN
jgi:hypothetical protein